MSSHLRYTGRELYVRLHDKNFLSDFNLSYKLSEGSTLVTGVHAELQIVDYFSRKKLDFIDDKYVGYSKPACNFCHQWISLHPGCFEAPAAHRKVILGCRGPDVDRAGDVKANGAKVRRKLYQRLTRATIRAIEEQVRNDYASIPAIYLAMGLVGLLALLPLDEYKHWPYDEYMH
ncbi:nucleic acid/nucleotide deaminase domain-containing protein [Aspergillus undulatus]|uniref:nucleic acid/nucleotide deaminase domain-containing protein n=1 Tax=Aspergillus undulatus TaxID=1810928 RepID=UPI003CCE1F04